MPQNTPIPFRRPSDRAGARRPDDSPTPAPRNVSVRPPPVISASDPLDEFRPQYCPHCLKNISTTNTNQNYGYLCPDCFVSLTEWRRKAFVSAARGLCKGPCNGMLSDEERKAQKYVCAQCSEGHEKSLRDYVSTSIDTAQAKATFRTATEQYNARLANHLVHTGMCKNLTCAKIMDVEDRFISGSRIDGERYVYCARCRSGISMKFTLGGTQRPFETTTLPITREVPYEGRLLSLTASSTILPSNVDPSLDDPFTGPSISPFPSSGPPFHFSSSSPSRRIGDEVFSSMGLGTSSENSSERPPLEPIVADTSFQIYQDEETDEDDHHMTVLEETEAWLEGYRSDESMLSRLTEILLSVSPQPGSCGTTSNENTENVRPASPLPQQESIATFEQDRSEGYEPHLTEDAFWWQTMDIQARAEASASSSAITVTTVDGIAQFRQQKRE